MSKQQTHSGFAHLIIIVILAVALVGSIGYIVWNNFSNNQSKTADNSSTSTNNSSSSNSNSNTSTAVTYKTFTTDKFNISFEYPGTWSLTKSDVTNQVDFFAQSVGVKNENGEVIATFNTGIQGLGGTCDKTSTYSVLESESTTLKSDKPVYLSFSVMQIDTGGYDAHFGLSNSFSKIGDGQSCPNTFYVVYDPGLGDYLMSFGYFKHFVDMDAAKQYMDSDEYAAIEKMILSLTY